MNAGTSLAENVAGQVKENNGFQNFSVGSMLFDTVVGGISGASGGSGAGNKSLTNLGNQFIKRTVNTTAYKGLQAGFSVILHRYY
ncbi:MAG: hypothetical protein VB064_08210 [Oscillospiraceae bacterium]|nr:hypothetical protein [Oscillospiraceae bacterium]